jgi:hypothetical protein
MLHNLLILFHSIFFLLFFSLVVSSRVVGIEGVGTGAETGVGGVKCIVTKSGNSVFNTFI